MYSFVLSDKKKSLLAILGTVHKEPAMDIINTLVDANKPDISALIRHK